MDVSPLGRTGLAELAEAVIGHPPPGPLVDWIAERSQGNPLFAIGLLRALIEEQGDLAQPHLHRLPEGLTERVTSELRRFDEPEREILELLAVVGRPVSFGDAAALSGGALDDVGPILSELVNSGIVVEEERGTELSYEVHHPLVRDVIYQATGGARRRVLHRQAARSLQRGGHLPEAALHYARSAERGDSEAVDVLLDAMRQAERREAYREALELQAELVDLLPADDARWLEVLDAMYERAEWLIDHRAETNAPVAVKALRAIDGLLEQSSDDARRAIVKFRLATFLAWGTGELDQAHEACLQAHELFGRAGERQQTLLAARELAWITGLQGDLAGMGTQARAVVDAADAAGDRFVAMQGLAAVSYSANFRGEFAEGEAALRRGRSDRPRGRQGVSADDRARRARARTVDAGSSGRDSVAVRGGEGGESGLSRQHPGRGRGARALSRGRLHGVAGSGAGGRGLAAGDDGAPAHPRPGVRRHVSGRVWR